MNGRCETDPLHSATVICIQCGGEFCEFCALRPFGKNSDSVCKPCTIAASGIRGGKPPRRLSRRELAKRRQALAENSSQIPESTFTYFDETGEYDELESPGVEGTETQDASGRRRLFRLRRNQASAEAATDEPPAVHAASGEGEDPTPPDHESILSRIGEPPPDPQPAAGARASELVEQLRHANLSTPPPGDELEAAPGPGHFAFDDADVEEATPSGQFAPTFSAEPPESLTKPVTQPVTEEAGIAQPNGLEHLDTSLDPFAQMEEWQPLPDRAESSSGTATSQPPTAPIAQPNHQLPMAPSPKNHIAPPSTGPVPRAPSARPNLIPPQHRASVGTPPGNGGRSAGDRPSAPSQPMPAAAAQQPMPATEAEQPVPAALLGRPHGSQPAPAPDTDAPRSTFNGDEEIPAALRGSTSR